MSRAVELWRTSRGAEHPIVGHGLMNMAHLLLHSGRPAEAAASAEAAIAALTRAHGERHLSLKTAHENAGAAYRALGRRADARAALERALAIGEASYGTDSPTLNDPLTDLGRVALAEGDRRGAAALLERALALARPGVTPPYDFGETELALARALWDLGAQQRARELARAAVDHFAQAGEKGADERAEASAWLAARGG